MAESATKKPPPRPLKRPSLSGIQTLKADGRTPSGSTNTSALDRPEAGPDDSIGEFSDQIEKANFTIVGSSPSVQDLGDPIQTPKATSQSADDASSISHNEDGSQCPPGPGDSHSLADTDDESDDIRPSMIGDSDFRGKLLDVVEVILSVDSRLKSVEKRFSKGSTPEQKIDVDDRPAQKAEVDEVKPPERLPCIPQIAVLDWYNFKHKWTGDKKYAIEVLKGPAKYYQDREKEQQKYEKSKKIGNTPIRSPSIAEQNVLPPQDVPERIRIISSPLIAIITELDPLGFPLDLSPGMMLRPYRCLIRMEDDLMKHLSGLEAKWGLAEKEDLERQAGTESHIAGVESDSVTPCADSSLAANTISKDEVSEPKYQVPIASDPLTDSIEALRDLRCLKRFLETYIHPTVSRLRDRTARKIKFADLWYLFPHGEEVFVPSAHGTEVKPTFAQSAASPTPYQSVYRVYDHSGGRVSLSKPNDDDPDDDAQISSTASRANPFRLMCYHIDWTSKSYWPVSHMIEIKAFDNERDITSLDVYPTAYYETFESVREQLLERGRRFLELTKPTHMNYFGWTYQSHPCGPFENDKYPLSGTPFVESEVMIDFGQITYNWRPKFGLLECISYPREDIEEWDMMVYRDKEHSQVESTFEESMFTDYADEKWLREHARENDSFLHEWELYRTSRHKEPITSLERSNDIVLLPSRVMGYSFRDRTFNALDIDRLDPITQGNEGFEGLELPTGHQQLVEALVKEHFVKKEAYTKHGKSTPGMDIVSGKGKGLIMLLHGFPGVGKTSTAECVAQSTGRPLFPITCGDLGLEPRQVEDSLNANFRLAAIWNCVMLLDEADIFLARRDKLDVRRNALVSVFLRVLEYYEGILFLTTNRVGTFDDAFKSRIHVSLCYPKLTRTQTIKIWKKNLNRLKKIEDARAEITEKPRLEISDREIIAYAKKHYKEHEQSRYGLWNGRQIRNAFQTAAALAYHGAGADGPKLTPGLFEQVAKTTDEFDKYINSVYGEKSEEERSYDHYERIDHAARETGKQTIHTYTSSQPVTPSHPRGRHFADKGAQDMQRTLQDSAYASRGGTMELSEHATFASSANSSRVFTETTLMPDNMYASPGASWRSNSPSVMAKAPRPPTMDHGHNLSVEVDSDEEDEEDD